MQFSQPQSRVQPEALLRHLVARLGRHVLWDALLAFVPPALALIYILAFLNRAAWLSSSMVLLLAIAIAGLTALAVTLRYRPAAPSMASAARMADLRSRSMDRFLTLATIDAAKLPAHFLARLRAEAARFGERIKVKQDFPYRLKRSAWWSMGGSLVAALLFHWLFPLAAPALQPSAGAQQRLRELAEQMRREPSLRELAKDLTGLALKLEDPQISRQEKQDLIQEIEKKIEEQQKQEQDKDKRDLLAQAAGETKGLEKQELAKGQEGEKSEQKGGGVQTNLPQEKQGENKQSQSGSGENQSGSGENKGDSKPEPSSDNQQGKPRQGDAKEPGPEKNQQQGDEKNNRPDPDRPGKEPRQEKIAKNAEGSKDGSGKNKTSEEPPPQGTPPADRYYKPGEGPEGIRGPRYVTVQLPEDLAADSKGESRPSKQAKGSRARTEVPVSNVPLPSHVPDAPKEKQQMPIEYRGVIR